MTSCDATHDERALGLPRAGGPTARLLALGRGQGYLTLDQIDDALPLGGVGSVEIDDLLHRLDELGVEVVEQPPPETAVERRRRVARRREPERRRARDLGGTRRDAIGLYLNEIGRVPLLSAEREAALGRRLEEGRQQLVEALLGLPVVVRSISRLAGALGHAELAVDEALTQLGIDSVTGGHRPTRAQLLAWLADLQLHALRTQSAAPRRDWTAGVGRDDAGASAAENASARDRLRAVIRQMRFTHEPFRRHLDEVSELLRADARCAEEIRRCEALVGLDAEASGRARRDAEPETAGAGSRGRRQGISREVLAQIDQTIDGAWRKRRRIEVRAGVPRDELARTGRRIETLRRQVDRVRNAFVQANLRLVAAIAKRYAGRGLSYLDLIQEGNIGLMTAVDKYDHRRENRFSTLATWWVRQAMTRAITNQSRTIRIPVHMAWKNHELACVRRTLLQKLGREPEPEEIAERAGVSAEQVRAARMIDQRPASLEAPIGTDEASPLGQFLEDESAESPEATFEQHELATTVAAVLTSLYPHEEQILRLRYGIGESSEHTLHEVGQEFDLTRERIRQIEARAFGRLRHPVRARQLEPFLETR